MAGTKEEASVPTVVSNLSPEERFAAIRSVGIACESDEELRALIASGRPIVCCDGFEPSGRLHIAQGLYKVLLVNRLIQAGCSFIFVIGDYQAMLNNKYGGDLKKIRAVGTYMIEVWKSLGMDMRRVQFVFSSELIARRPMEYWPHVMEIARRNNMHKILSCGEIMGHDIKALECEDTALKSLTGASVLYPAMQAADALLLQADILQMGADQASAGQLLREYCTQLGREKPIILSHRLLPDLKTPASKMSTRNPEGALLMDDSEADFNSKIKKAFLAPNETAGSPLFDLIEMIILTAKGEFAIPREGDQPTLTFNSVAQLSAAYVAGEVHPGDLKKAVVSELTGLMTPTREYFKSNAQAKQLFTQIKALKV
eukprot:gnl/Hemi2/14137_TR4800_c0_g1_i1.p1 gnl/Hemi2/14137_TR4800_c0_g1~~gnl/Hemi2/14137_TR4800_c0_g1_i1.p1  ORF type:complete len:388 (+),score=136.56 gnl/Hemi2/14137_TR4800_c0_g1_i1:52-1164(+)